MNTLRLKASRIYLVLSQLGFLESMSLTSVGWTWDRDKALPMSRNAADGLSEYFRMNDLDAETVLRDVEHFI